MLHRLALLVLAAALLAPSAFAADPAPVTVEQLRVNADELAAGTLHATPLPTAPAARRPLQLELESILADEEVRLAALLDELGRAASPANERRIERQIDQLRQHTELELLRAQLRHAQANGEPGRAATIAQAIQAILDPPHPAGPTIEREVQR